MQLKCRYGLEDVIARPCFHTSTYIFRRAEFKIPACTRTIGIMMDTLLMAAAALQGSLKCIPDTVSVYRMHPDGFFSTLNLLSKYERTIELLHAILSFADERYSLIIKKKIDAVRMWLCFELVADGQLYRARGLAWQTVRSLAWHAPRKALILLFHVYLPRTSQPIIDAWNRRNQRSAAASVPKAEESLR